MSYPFVYYREFEIYRKNIYKELEEFEQLKTQDLDHAKEIAKMRLQTLNVIDDEGNVIDNNTTEKDCLSSLSDDNNSSYLSESEKLVILKKQQINELAKIKYLAIYNPGEAKRIAINNLSAAGLFQEE